MALTTLDVRWQAGVTHVRLDRRHRRNAIDLTMARELLDVCLDQRTLASRAVLLSGVGEHFCVGGDLKSFREQPHLPGHLLEVTTYLHAALARLTALPAPLVVAARGHVAGAGLGLACLGDVLLATHASTFRSGYAALGLTPDAATSYLLPRLVGIRRAQRITLLGHVVTAAEALDWGLCTELVSDARLVDRAEEVALALAAGPTLALGETARLLREASRRTLVEQLEDESTTLSAMAERADAREGLAAWTQRRAPRFHNAD